MRKAVREANRRLELGEATGLVRKSGKETRKKGQLGSRESRQLRRCAL